MLPEYLVLFCCLQQAGLLPAPYFYNMVLPGQDAGQETTMCSFPHMRLGVTEKFSREPVTFANLESFCSQVTQGSCWQKPDQFQSSGQTERVWNRRKKINIFLKIVTGLVWACKAEVPHTWQACSWRGLVTGTALHVPSRRISMNQLVCSQAQRFCLCQELQIYSRFFSSFKEIPLDYLFLKYTCIYKVMPLRKAFFDYLTKIFRLGQYFLLEYRKC